MDHHTDDKLNSLGHEPIETDVRNVWRTGAVLATVVIASYVLIIGLLKWFATSDGGPPASYSAKTDPEWDEQNPMQQLRLREQQVLQNYEWVEPSAGVARIPVDRAIEIVAETGLPTALPNSASTDSTSTPRSDPPDRFPPPPGNDEP